MESTTKQHYMSPHYCFKTVYIIHYEKVAVIKVTVKIYSCLYFSLTHCVFVVKISRGPITKYTLFVLKDV